MKPNNKNGKKKSNYIKQQEEKLGANFICSKNPKELYNEMPRILAEFTNYNIDLKTYGYMFLTTQFLQACKNYCMDQMNILYVLNRNFEAYSKMAVLDEYDITMIQTIQLKYQAYDLIFKTMNHVEYTSSFNPLFRLQQDLNKYYRPVLQRGTNI